MKRRGALGLISHITPLALPIFLVLFYAPVIATPFRAYGWGRAAALGMGFLIPLAWVAIGGAAIALLPPRFAKLNLALELLVIGLPIVGAFGIVLWDVARLVWRLAH